MAAASSVETICNRLKSSRLLKDQQVRSIYQQWRRLEAPGSRDEVNRFTRWLVSSHYLTSYQAQQILVGNTNYFLINHYKLLDLIGKGRMAGIFKAAHTSGHIVAIKIMPASKAQDPKLLARFKREAKMAVRLTHANAVRTFHLGHSAGRHYIVMEFLEGETLEEVLKRRKKLPYPEACRLVHDALLGLQHIHEMNMVHRDLKPGNLMVVPLRPPGAPDNTLHQTVKILDIGLGRFLFDEGMTEDVEQMRLTTEGSLLGSLEYMAPEQAKDAHNVDIRADIYGLGSVLYQLLCGQPPFAEKNSIQQIIRLTTENPRPIRELEPGVPEGLWNVLAIMLAKEPRQRFATPHKAAQALTSFVGTPKEMLPQPAPLGQSYLKWVETQPLEEVSGATPGVADRWYYRQAGRTFGPVSSAQLDQLAATGQLAPDDTLWMEGDDPSLGIHARAALDFSNVQRKGHGTHHKPAANATTDAGFDPETGRIRDPEKFRQWQREQKRRRDEQLAAGPMIQEVFFKARNDLSSWVDLDRNRQLIVSGDMDAIRKDPAIQRFMHLHQRYGDEMLHKLWQHLEFMIENRRKYFYALGRPPTSAW